MGFLDRVLGGANTAYEKWSDLTTLGDQSFDATRRRLAEGDLAVGTITGIRQRWNEDVTECFLALVATDTDGGVHRFGVHPLFRPAVMARLRLGLRVPLRIDGTKAVLDGPALADVLGLDLEGDSQRSRRSAPDDGIDDRCRDARVLLRLKRWPRSTATVTRLDPISLLGMRTENWDVHVQLADGSPALAPREVVPFYVQSLVAPGTEVPVAVDPDGGTVAVDWPAFATSVAGPSDPTTPPMSGSIAELLTSEAASDAAVSEQEIVTSPPTPETPPGGGVTNASLVAWVDGVNGGYMKPKELDKGARDLVEAGMVTQEEADAARRAVGLL